VRIPDDLDPADALLRTVLISTLRLSRESRGIARRQIGDILGVTAPTLHALEHRTTWEARTIARYARVIGWRIEWVLHELTVPDDGDVMAIVIAAGDTSTPEREDRVHWRTICNDLVRIRRAGLTAVAMAERLGVHENAVHYWEGNPDGSSVIAAQRHARALGGVLGWQLHPVASRLVNHAPEPRKAA
jgi:DNA-binding XRE family transcriptional regulator